MEYGEDYAYREAIPELRRRDYRVGTIKHNIYGFDIDHEGKDSWRHKRAGAKVTAIASPESVAVVEDADRDYGLAELRDRYIRDVDIIISEGFKKNPYPKIEIMRSDLKHEPICRKEDNLVAVVSDVKVESGVPCLGIDDAKGIAELMKIFLHGSPRRGLLLRQRHGPQMRRHGSC